MANIEYRRNFSHLDWLDNEDVVQAEGENGFNLRFHALEDELDTIGDVVGQVQTALDEGLGVRPVAVASRVLAGEAVSAPEEVETYDNSDYPEGLRRIYQVALEPVGSSAHGQVSSHFIYEPQGDQTRVSIGFKNETAAATRFNARIFAIN